MASSKAQLHVEDWVRREWLPLHFKTSFTKKMMRLAPGGEFEFDAVSVDGSVIASISTTDAATAGGKGPAGKLKKLQADMLFLLMAAAPRRILVLTERRMLAVLEKERANGRVPVEIDLLHVDLPADLRTLLATARKSASDEVNPKRRPE